MILVFEPVHGSFGRVFFELNSGWHDRIKKAYFQSGDYWPPAPSLEGPENSAPGIFGPRFGGANLPPFFSSLCNKMYVFLLFAPAISDPRNENKNGSFFS